MHNPLENQEASLKDSIEDLSIFFLGDFQSYLFDKQILELNIKELSKKIGENRLSKSLFIDIQRAFYMTYIIQIPFRLYFLSSFSQVSLHF